MKGLLIVAVVALLGVVGYLAWPKEDPCVAKNAIERNPQYRTTLYPGTTFAVQGFSRETLPEDVARRYDEAYFACARSLGIGN
jgi:hypothetical protein